MSWNQLWHLLAGVAIFAGAPVLVLLIVRVVGALSRAVAHKEAQPGKKKRRRRGRKRRGGR
jgi:hypothetical protein